MPEWMTIPDLPDDSQERRIHFERYEYAAGMLKGKRVLDCACGMGYGTDLMRRAGVASYGVDIDPAAIELAQQRYGGRYAVDDIHTTPLDGYDAVVSFETLEHVDNPVQIIDRFAANIPEIIASAPIRPTIHINHWHRSDFTPSSFRALIRRGYRIIHEQGQLWSDGEDMYLLIHGKRQ
jgi:SAM-dependent methyltransferase